MAKLKHNIPEDIQELLPDAIEIAKQKKLERLRKSLEQPIHKQHGAGLNNVSSKNIDHYNPVLHKTRTNLFQTTNRGRKIIKKGPYEI